MIYDPNFFEGVYSWICVGSNDSYHFWFCWVLDWLGP